MCVPICLTTYTADEHRLGYFQHTIESLRKSNTNLSRLKIYDDHSPFAAKADALWQCEIPYTIRERNLGTYGNTRLALEEAFSTYTTDFAVLVQDDVLVSRGWLTGALAIAHTIPHLGILSLYHYKEHSIDPDVTEEVEYRVMRNGHPGAVCWLVSRGYWDDLNKKYPMSEQEKLLTANDRLKHHDCAHLVDWKLCRCAHIMGWVVAYTRKALVQHVGKKSSLGTRDMGFTLSPYFVGEEWEAHGPQ